MSQEFGYTDEKLLQLLQEDSERAIDLLFRAHYSYLCRVVYRIIPDSNLVEDLVQDVFYELWKKKDTLQIKSTVRGYLKRAAVNKSLNYVRDQKMKFDDAQEGDIVQKDTQFSIQKQMEGAEMQQIINKAIDDLPERCRIIFVLSRFEEMTYQEIADSLDISIKTVENQISKALKQLRISLAPYKK